MINLLPYTEKENILRVRTLRSVMVTLWSAVMLVIVLCLLLIPAITTINGRYSLAQSEIVRLENAGAVVRPETIAESETRAKLVQEEFAAATVLPPHEAIALVRALVPNGITLTGFSYTIGSEQTLVLEGMVTTREVLQSYVDSLQANEQVAMIDSPITNYLKQKDNEFTLTITFKK